MSERFQPTPEGLSQEHTIDMGLSMPSSLDHFPIGSLEVAPRRTFVEGVTLVSSDRTKKSDERLQVPQDFTRLEGYPTTGFGNNNQEEPNSDNIFQRVGEYILSEISNIPRDTFVGYKRDIFGYGGPQGTPAFYIAIVAGATIITGALGNPWIGFIGSTGLISFMENRSGAWKRHNSDWFHGE